jgi:hypothetical protein
MQMNRELYPKDWEAKATATEICDTKSGYKKVRIN